MIDYLSDNRFKGIKPFEKKVWLSSPTMHGDELKYVTEAYETNWMSTVGENINAVEYLAADRSGKKYAVALSSGTAALHLCVKLAGERLYGKPRAGHGTLEGEKVFCSDMTFDATVNPVVYEGGTPIFIDTDKNTWSMDVSALKNAFKMYPDVKLVIYAELYGFPGEVEKIREICDKHNALLIEDAAEALGATFNNIPCGAFGDYSAISFNGNKIITGSTGGCLLTDDPDAANRARKWSTQSREAAPWYQHEEVGYNYRMSNVVAGVIRGQYNYLDTHIAEKKKIYERYAEGFKGLPVGLNPIIEGALPNYWLSALVIDKEYMCKQVRDDYRALYVKEKEKSCPTEILEALQAFNAEGRPIWKPMHMQPLYRENAFVTREGDGRALTNAYIAGGMISKRDNLPIDMGAYIFDTGLCLPSDNKMTEAQQNTIIEIVKRCFL